MRAEDRLTQAAARLQRMYPEDWKEFTTAMRELATQRATECVRSSVEVVQVNQGRAQQAASLADLFEDAVNNADRIVKRRSSEAGVPTR